LRRVDKILVGIDKAMLGLEIAPWFNPIASKSDGFNIRTLDVFDDEVLMARALEDPNIAESSYSKLETVDYVGSATEIATLVPAEQHGTFDYIISSHNFEHLPNPIKFLQGCESLLKESGLVNMAVPDGRLCFDYFRPHTVTADWLDAFLADRKAPTPRQVFAQNVDRAVDLRSMPDDLRTVSGTTKQTFIGVDTDVSDLWATWQAGQNSDEYVDCHCTVMTPASLRLLIEDCVAIGLFNFRVLGIEEGPSLEFFVRLQKVTSADARTAEDYINLRAKMMHQIWDEHAIRTNSEAAKRRGWDGTILGAVKIWNRNRLAKRRNR